MASVDLTRSFLSLAADPTQTLALSTISKAQSPTITGSVNQYAAGRFRVVTLAGISDSDDLTFTLVDATTRTTLESWLGQVVCYRDPHGTKHYGAYLTMKSTEQIGINYSDVEITLTTVTWSEVA